MNRLLPSRLMELLASLTMVASGFYLLLQFLMLLLSLNIKRILKCSDKSAYDFLQKGSFWKGKGKKRVWYLKGPGLTRLRRNLLSAAKKETREKLFQSNAILTEQCGNCIFQLNCEEKYTIDCNGCKNRKSCLRIKEKNNLNICNHFLCAKWIEKD